MFRDLIQEIWKTTPGLENVMFSGTDGIVVARHHETPKDDFIAAELGNLIKETMRFGQELDADDLTSLGFQYGNKAIFIQMVTEEYFLIAIVTDPEHLGVVRYRFTLMAHEWYSAIA
jgi:predicted regulator of Ras-like GTPase activity (Roadblock/LC7/MglB family)